jgi:hypothetical protein
MAEAMPSLSSKRAAERMRRLRSAVICLALHRAKTAVLAELRAQGLKVWEFTACEIKLRAEAYLISHHRELISKAAADIAT